MPIRWRLGGVANTETERYPILGTEAPGIPDFRHWSNIYCEQCWKHTGIPTGEILQVLNSMSCDEIRLSVEFVTVGFLGICRQYCCD